jgi:ABC-2 type transport system permease protein
VRLVWSSARKDLRRQIRDPSALVLSVALPLVVGSLMVLAFGGSQGPPPKARVLVADEDDSLVSGLLVQALGRVEVIEVQRAPRAAARARIDAGGVSALLIIPAGFGDALLDDKPTQLQLVTNPAQRVLPGIVEETLRIFVDGAFYARRLLDEPLRQMRSAPPAGRETLPDETIARISIAINHLLERVRPYLFPPAIVVETKVAEAKAARPARSLALVFFPGMLLMAILFTTQGQSADVWRELQQGTLRRALTTPGGLGPFLAGKILAGTLVLAAVSLVALAFAVLALGLPARALPLGFLWCVFIGGVFLALMVLLQVHGSSPQGANMLITIVLLPLIMIGGNLFPFEAMPPWLAAIGRLTPNGWALAQLQAILAGKAQPGVLLVAFAALGAIGVLALLLSARRMRRGFIGA